MGRLAKPGDPYCSPRGEVKAPENQPPSEIGKDLTLAAPIVRNLTINSKRNPGEMPSNDLSTQTAINAIMMYHLLGLTQNEIANILRLDMVTVQNLQFSSDYQVTFEMLFNEIISTNSNSLQATLGRHAHSAIDQLVNLHKNAESEMVRLKASQDIADRAGLHHETLYGKHGGGEEDTLKIIIHDADNDEKAKINIEVKHKR